MRVRRAAAGEAPGKYRLIVKVAALEPGAEVEPDDAVAAANELALPGEAIGYLGWKKDQDFYRLPTAGLAEGSVVAADLDPVPGVSAKLALLDAAAKHAVGGARPPRRARGVAQRARAGGRGAGLPGGWRPTTAGTPTSAMPSASAPICRSRAPRRSPTMTPRTRRPSPTAACVQGYLGRGDVDLYRYAATAPAVLVVEIAPPERASLKLELSNDAGVVLARGKPAGKGARAPLRASLPLPVGQRPRARDRRAGRGQSRRALPSDRRQPSGRG